MVCSEENGSNMERSKELYFKLTKIVLVIESILTFTTICRASKISRLEIFTLSY
jgi:hypothetical protein